MTVARFLHFEEAWDGEVLIAFGENPDLWPDTEGLMAETNEWLQGQFGASARSDAYATAAEEATPAAARPRKAKSGARASEAAEGDGREGDGEGEGTDSGKPPRPAPLRKGAKEKARAGAEAAGDSGDIL